MGAYEHLLGQNIWQYKQLQPLDSKNKGHKRRKCYTQASLMYLVLSNFIKLAIQ